MMVASMMVDAAVGTVMVLCRLRMMNGSGDTLFDRRLRVYCYAIVANQ